MKNEPYSKFSVSFSVLVFILAGIFTLITVAAVYISTLETLPQTPIILGPPVG